MIMFKKDLYPNRYVYVKTPLGHFAISKAMDAKAANRFTRNVDNNDAEKDKSVKIK